MLYEERMILECEVKLYGGGGWEGDRIWRLQRALRQRTRQRGGAYSTIERACRTNLLLDVVHQEAGGGIDV